jgi:hypothetical protein
MVRSQWGSWSGDVSFGVCATDLGRLVLSVCPEFVIRVDINITLRIDYDRQQFTRNLSHVLVLNPQHYSEKIETSTCYSTSVMTRRRIGTTRPSLTVVSLRRVGAGRCLC